MHVDTEAVVAILAEVEDWPVDAPAVGVTDASATIAVHGPTGRVSSLASVTKPLVAHAILVAVQDGLLHLDEPAGPPGATVRHLLAHASGLPMDTGGLGGEVGARRIYSNAGFELLGDLVADRVGSTFADHLRDEILDPLGLQDTRLEGSPAHAAVGSVDDLLAYARELLAPSILDDELATAQATVQFGALPGVLPGYGRQVDNAWGLGVEIRGTKSPHWTGPGQSPATFGHFGQSGSFLWVDRDLGVAVACLCDQQFGDWAAEAWAPFNDRLYTALR